MMNEVYITKAAKFLPNEPVSNDEMEDYLGLIHKNHSKSKRIVLRNNGIKSRYYAMDKNGKPTHTNSQMASLAIRGLFGRNFAAFVFNLTGTYQSFKRHLPSSFNNHVHRQDEFRPGDRLHRASFAFSPCRRRTSSTP